MTEIRIRRRSREQAATIGTVIDASSTVRLDDMAAGIVHLAGMSTAVATLEIWAASAPGGPYTPLVAADGSLAVIALNTATASCYELPAAVRGAAYLRLVADSEPGTATEAVISLKS